MKAIATISMLHEPADANSATRQFRDQSVLGWTVSRVAQSQGLAAICVICFDDQRLSVESAVVGRAVIHSLGRRRMISGIESFAAARRWSDGWRGGLLNSTDFDLGFDGTAIQAAAAKHAADAVVLVDPAAGLVDAELLTRLVRHAAAQGDSEFAFLPASPGFGAMLLKLPLVARLTGANLSPGRLLTYQPEAPMREPLSTPACVDVPLPVARTLGRFKLDSQSQINRLSKAWAALNGTLAAAAAEQLVSLATPGEVESLPRDVVIELNTVRLTRPVFSAVRSGQMNRSAMSVETATSIFSQLSARDDVRLTLGGVGDPLLHPHLNRIILEARRAGIRAIHVETDLLADSSDAIDQLAASSVDVVSVNIPAVTAGVYTEVMGVDALPRVIDHVRRFLTTRAGRGSGVPIFAPTFVKTKLNLGEMEAWYDQWLRAVGSAVVVGPSDLCGAIDDVSVGDMSPPSRVPCRRIRDRMTILSDGRVVSCEEDVHGRNVIGNLQEQSVAEIWKTGFGRLRILHGDRRWSECELCAGCREWHRP